MGRPSSCNICCAGTIEDLPPVLDCEGVIAVVFMDESDRQNRSKMNDKVATYLSAYPDRLLFIMDVIPQGYSPLKYSEYPNFTDSKRCFSLALEKQGGGAGTWTDDISEYIGRDSTIGSASSGPPKTGVDDVYSYITKIVNNSPKTTGVNSADGDIVRAIWKNATEVSIFRDNSGSMYAHHVQTAYDLFKTKLEAGDETEGIVAKAVKHSISNKNEDFICPFVFGHCCINDKAKAIAGTCGVTCIQSRSFKFTTQPQPLYVVDDPCDPACGNLSSASVLSSSTSLSHTATLGFNFQKVADIWSNTVDFQNNPGTDQQTWRHWMQSNRFGSDLAMSANGDTIAVVEENPLLFNMLDFTNTDLGGGIANHIAIPDHGLRDGDIVRYGYAPIEVPLPTFFVPPYPLEGIYFEPDAPYYSTTNGIPITWTNQGELYKVVNSNTNTFELACFHQYCDGEDPDHGIEITDNDRANTSTRHYLAWIYDPSMGQAQFDNFLNETLETTPAKISTYKREIDGPDGSPSCTDLPNISYDLTNELRWISSPVTRGGLAGVSIDLSDDGKTLIVGSPKSGTLLDYLAVDSVTEAQETRTSSSDDYWDDTGATHPRGRATGEWRVYDWAHGGIGWHWQRRGNPSDYPSVSTDSSDGQAVGTMVSISSDGNTAVVSTSIDSAGSTTTKTWYPDDSNRGFVYVYDWNGSTWVQRGSRIRDISNEHDVGDSGYPRYFSIDANADYIAISTYRYDPSSSQLGSVVTRENYGAVRVFKYDESTSDWVQLGNIISPVPDADYAANLGNSVAVAAAKDKYFGNAVCLSKDTSQNPPRLAVMDIDSVYVYDYETVDAVFNIGFGNVYASTDKFSFDNGHPFQNGDMVRYNVHQDFTDPPDSAYVLEAKFDNLGHDSIYEVSDVSGDTFKLKGDLGYINITSDDESNGYVHKFTIDKWVQKGNVIDRESQAGLLNRQTSEYKSPSIAFSEDRNTIIIGDDTPLDDQPGVSHDRTGLVRALQLVNDEWVVFDGSNAFRSSDRHRYGFGTDVLLSRRDSDESFKHGPSCDEYVIGETLVFSEPYRPHGSYSNVFGQVQVYVSTPTLLPITTDSVVIHFESRAGDLLGATREEFDAVPSIECGGKTTATKITFRFTISGGTWDQSVLSNVYSSLIEVGDWSVTKGVLESLNNITVDGDNFQFEGLVIVSNTDDEGGVTLSLPQGAFTDDHEQGNEAATCTIQYEPIPVLPTPPTTPPTDPIPNIDPCSQCPTVVRNDHVVKYLAAVSPLADINYVLQYRDSSNDVFQNLSNLTDKSVMPHELSTILPSNDPCGELPFGVNPDAFQDIHQNDGCTKRVFTREFRIMAKTTDDAGDTVAYSNEFNLYQYFATDLIKPEPSDWGWVREFTTTRDLDTNGNAAARNFSHSEPAIGKPGEKLIISRFDMIRTNDTSGPNAFNSVLTRFKLCPAIVVPKYRSTQVPAEQRYYGFQRLLVSSAYHPRINGTSDSPAHQRGAIQHYVAGSPDATFYSDPAEASKDLQTSSHWFFEDKPFTISTQDSIHEGDSDDANLGYSIAPIRSKDPKPSYEGPTPHVDVPTGFWFMDGTKLVFDETYGHQFDGTTSNHFPSCSNVTTGDYGYGHLYNSYSSVACDARLTREYELGPDGLGILSEGDTTAQIATDGDGDTVAVSAPYPYDNNPAASYSHTYDAIHVFRTYGGLGFDGVVGTAIHEIFSSKSIPSNSNSPDDASQHWRPSNLCLNDDGNVLGYIYRPSNYLTHVGQIAIWELLGETHISNPNASEHHQGVKRRMVNPRSLFAEGDGVGSNISVLKMDKSGNNIIVSCTLGKVQTEDYTETTGWAQVLKYNPSLNEYVARGQRLEGVVLNGQFGIDCDISSDGDSIVISSREANIDVTQDPAYNHHGAIRCYTWDGSSTQWEQLGETIRGTNHWSNLGFHLSYEADHVKRIAAFEGTDQSDPFRGDISMYRFEEI